MHLDAYIVPRPHALCAIDLTLTVHCNAVDEKLCKKVFDTQVLTNWFAFYSRSVLNTSHTASVLYSRARSFVAHRSSINTSCIPKHCIWHVGNQTAMQKAVLQHVTTQLTSPGCLSNILKPNQFKPFHFKPRVKFRLCHMQEHVFKPVSWNWEAHKYHTSLPNSPKDSAQKNGKEMAAIGAKGLYSLEAFCGFCLDSNDPL